MNALREKIIDQIDVLQEQARGAWANLNHRERIILMVAAGLLSLSLIALVAKQLGEVVFSSRFDLRTQLQDVREIERLVSELKGNRMHARQFDRFSESQKENFSLDAFIEQQARAFGLQIAEIIPSRAKSTLAKESDELREVKLGPETNLDNGLKFLEAVEQSLGVRIINLNIKPNFTDPTKLEIRVLVAHNKKL